MRAPVIDFTDQLNFAASEDDVENKILYILRSIAKGVNDHKNDKLGALVVLGSWSLINPRVEGMLQLKSPTNPVEKLITINSLDNVDLVKYYSSYPFDGAMIINTQGQIIGAGVYLVVDNPTAEIPEGCGTRHKAAASFSMREDVTTVFTLSEETNIIRTWKNGIHYVE